MDTNNWRPTCPNGEPTMDAGDWRTQLQPDSRQRIVNKIMDTLKRHLPFSGQEGLNKLRKIAVRFEEKIFTAASSWSDYRRRISLKMLTMETKSPNPISNAGNTSKPPDPASLDSTAQTGHANEGDWQEEVYQKIKTMKETYYPELNEVYQKIAAKLQQHDSLPQQPKSEQLEKLELFKNMLERIIAFLSVSKANIPLTFKEKLGSNEKQIIHFINTNIRNPASALQQGQLPPPHMHSMQQSQPQINQTQSHDNQMNPQMPSINIQGSVPTMQPKNMTSLQHDPLSSLTGVSTAQQTMLNSLQPGSECPAPDTHNGMSTPPLLAGLKNANVTHGNALKTDCGKSNVTDQRHDPRVTMFQAKPMSLESLSTSVVTMVDEAAAAVGEDLAAVRKRGLHARSIFPRTGLTEAVKMRCFMSAMVTFALIVWCTFFLNHQH